MKYFQIVFSVIILIWANGCGSLSSRSPQSGRITAIQANGKHLYFYRVIWDDAVQACFLTDKPAICEGLHRNNDVYYPVSGKISIYYQTSHDTLFVYTRQIPHNYVDLGIAVVHQEIPEYLDSTYEQRYLQGALQKVVIDSLTLLDCELKVTF